MDKAAEEILSRLDERLSLFQDNTDRRLSRIEEKLDILNDQAPRHEVRLTSLETNYSRMWTIISGLAIGVIITIASFILQNIHFIN